MGIVECIVLAQLTDDKRVENSFSHPGKISAFACSDKARRGDLLAVRLNGRALFIYIRPFVINDSKDKVISYHTQRWTRSDA